MTLHEWAIRWQLPAAALQELQLQVFNLDPGPPSPALDGKSESAVQSAVRLAASARGDRLWRNNVGALLDERGIPVRYGLCNETKALNERFKSSDLIGIEHGTGRFLSFEVKEPGWRFTGTPREQAQLNWIGLIASLGGRAQFITDPRQY
jgi:hypothetical protein